MNPYRTRQLKSIRNRRTLDFFVMNNPSNSWLDLNDVTCYTYETNKPEAWQLKTVHNFLFSICRMEFSSNPDAVLEYSTDVSTNRWFYRLINKDIIKHECVRSKSPQEEMQDIVSRHSLRLKKKELSGI